MSHTKSQGAANRTVNVRGKRLGVKAFGGETVKAGAIIVRQKGTKFYPGDNTGIGRDHTIFATKSGIVQFKQLTGSKNNRKQVNIIPAENDAKQNDASKSAK